jgi:hypothetical protein
VTGLHFTPRDLEPGSAIPLTGEAVDILAPIFVAPEPACFINDLGTVLALGVVFAHYDRRLLIFGAVTVAVLIILARYAPRRGSVVQHNTSMYIEKITQVIHSQKAKLR